LDLRHIEQPLKAPKKASKEEDEDDKAFKVSDPLIWRTSNFKHQGALKTKPPPALLLQTNEKKKRLM
jgi:hypothetical protein